MGLHPLKSGKSEGWIFKPRYFAPFNILGGTNKPKETAMMRFISGLIGGDQPVNVSRSWMWRSGIWSSTATVLRVGMVRFLRPRPVAFPGRWKTEIDSIRDGLDTCSACRARKTVALSSSEPQNRIRSGSEAASSPFAGFNGRDSIFRSLGVPTSR